MDPKVQAIHHGAARTEGEGWCLRLRCFRSALMLAGEKGNTALCDYLINHGADITLRDLNGSWFLIADIFLKLQFLADVK